VTVYHLVAAGSLSLRIDLVPLAVAIVLISFSVSVAVVLIRDLSRLSDEADSLPLTLRLTLMVAVGLIGLTLLFQGLFE
jgi:hypothetical protein